MDDEATQSTPRSAHIISPSSIAIDPEPLGVGLTSVVRPGTPITAAPSGLLRQGSSRWLDVDVTAGTSNSLAGLRVAVKTYHVDTSPFPWGVVAAFKHEVAVQCTLKHPNLVPVLGCIVKEVRGAKSPTYALVMERMEESLHSRFVRSGASPQTAATKLRALADVAQGIAFVHADGAVHCGLSTSHLLFDSRGTAKVAGMGLLSMSAAARATAAGRAAAASADAGESAAWRYLAPELLPDPSPPVDDGLPPPPPVPTRQSDVYAFAIVAWEVVCQSVAYSPGCDGIPAATPADVRAGSRPPLERLPADLPPAFALMLQSAWHADPAERPTVYKILRALNRMKDKPLVSTESAGRLALPDGDLVARVEPVRSPGTATALMVESSAPAPPAPDDLCAMAVLTDSSAAAEPTLPQPVPDASSDLATAAFPLSESSLLSSGEPVVSADIPEARLSPPLAATEAGAPTVQESVSAPTELAADPIQTSVSAATEAAAPPAPDRASVATAANSQPAQEAAASGTSDGASAVHSLLAGGVLTPPTAEHLPLPTYDSDSESAERGTPDSAVQARLPTITVRLLDAEGKEIPRRQLRVEYPTEEPPRPAPGSPSSDAQAASDAAVVPAPRAAHVAAPSGLDPSLAAQVNAFGVVSLCRLLRSYEGHRGVVMGVGRRLGTLLTSATNCSDCVGARGAAAILDALSMHREDDEVVSVLCLALQLLAAPPEGKVAVVRARGIEALVGTLRRLVDNAPIARVCCRGISHLLYGSTPNAVAAYTAGAAELFVLAISTHLRDPTPVRFAARALALLAQLCPPSRARAVHAGAVQALLAALPLHSSHEAAAVCTALAALAEGSDSPCPAVLMRCGGAAPLVAAVLQHAEEADVAVPALALLARLADGEAAAAVLVAEAGAAAAAELVLRTLAGDEGAVCAACACLGALVRAGGNPGGGGSVPAIVGTMARWPSNAAVAGGACAALLRILGLRARGALEAPCLTADGPPRPPSACAPIAVVAVDAGGFAAVTAVVEAGVGLPHLISDACAVTCALLDVGGDGAAAAAAPVAVRVTAAIATAAARHPSDELLWWVCAVLSRLASASPGAEARVTLARAARPAAAVLTAAAVGPRAPQPLWTEALALLALAPPDPTPAAPDLAASAGAADASAAPELPLDAARAAAAGASGAPSERAAAAAPAKKRKKKAKAASAGQDAASAEATRAAARPEPEVLEPRAPPAGPPRASCCTVQ